MSDHVRPLTIAVAIAGIVYLAMRWSSPLPPGEGPEVGANAGSLPIAVEPSPPRLAASVTATPDNAATSPTPSPASVTGASAAAVSLQLALPRATVEPGAAIDVILSIDASQPLRAIAFDIAFDPALLRLRDLEEIDYSADAKTVRRGRFTADLVRDGTIGVRLIGEPLTGAGIHAIAQLEALRSGTGALDIRNVRMASEAGQPATAIVPTRTLPVSIR